MQESIQRSPAPLLHFLMTTARMRHPVFVQSSPMIPEMGREGAGLVPAVFFVYLYVTD